MRKVSLGYGVVLLVTTATSAVAQLSPADERSVRIMIAVDRASQVADGTPAPALEYCAAVRVLGATVTETLRMRRLAMTNPVDTSSASACRGGFGEHYRILKEFRMVGDSAFISASVRRGHGRFDEDLILANSGGPFWYVARRIQRDFVFDIPSR